VTAKIKEEEAIFGIAGREMHHFPLYIYREGGCVSEAEDL